MRRTPALTACCCGHTAVLGGIQKQSSESLAHVRHPHRRPRRYRNTGLQSRPKRTSQAHSCALRSLLGSHLPVPGGVKNTGLSGWPMRVAHAACGAHSLELGQTAVLGGKEVRGSNVSASVRQQSSAQRSQPVAGATPPCRAEKKYGAPKHGPSRATNALLSSHSLLLGPHRRPGRYRNSGLFCLLLTCALGGGCFLWSAPFITWTRFWDTSLPCHRERERKEKEKEEEKKSKTKTKKEREKDKERERESKSGRPRKPHSNFLKARAFV